MSLGVGVLSLVSGATSGTWGLVWRGAIAAVIGLASLALARHARRDGPR